MILKYYLMKGKKLVYYIPFLIIIGIVALLLYSTKSKNRGEVLYESRCANCHMDNGMGLQSLIPPLAQADYLSNYRNTLACLIKKGGNEEMIVNGVKYKQNMPGNGDLTDTDIANVLNFILTNWGNNETPLSLQEIQKQLEDCP